MKFKEQTQFVKFSCTICLLSLLSFQVNSQSVVFENGSPSPGTDVGYSVMEAPDGTLILVGSTTTDTEGLTDIKVSKLTAGGEEIWAVTHGGFNNDFPNSGIVLEDGSFVIVGTTGSFTDTPSRDVYLLKMNPNGEILWTHSYGGGGTDEGTGIKQTPEGDFIITANTESFGAGEMDGWLLKTDSDGNLLWDQTFGGSDIDTFAEVDVAADGGYILTGGTYSFSTGSEEDLWLIKTDMSGNEIWTQTFGVADRIDSGRDVAATADGYVAVGIYDNDPANAPQATGEALFIKVDLDGNLVWNQSVTGNFRVEGFSVYASQGEGLLICGTKVESPTSASFWVAKANAAGEIIWEVEQGQPATVGFALDVIQTVNGDVVAAGFSGLTQSSTQDIHVLRLSDQTLSVSEGPQTIEFVAMPNPTQGKLKVITSKNFTECTLQLRDATGKLVKSRKFNSGEEPEFDLSVVPAGMYLLQVITAQGVGTARIVKN